MRSLVAYLSCGLLLAALTTTTACVDEGTDEECVGLSCPGGFQWPHGGEIRMWYISLPGGGDITRFFGVFIEDEDPAFPELEGSRNTRPMPEIGRCAPDINGIQGLNRQYADLGPEMTFTLGGGQEITVPRIRAEDNDGMPFIDPYGRSHEVIYYLEDFNIREDSFFNTKHSGTVVEPLPYQIRNRETGEFERPNTLEGLYMPPEVEVLEPARDGVAEFKRGEPVNLEWRTLDSPAGDVAHGAAIVIVPAPGSGKRPTLCVVGNTGQFTIPAETVDALDADDGIMLVGLVANEAVVTDTGRMLNMWGISCDLVPWVKVD